MNLQIKPAAVGNVTNQGNQLIKIWCAVCVPHIFGVATP
jgi:hypothetical protein